MNSYWNVNIESKIIDNKSSKLIVLFPGINYSNDRVLIDYSKRLGLELGYDVVSVDYGFQIARKHFDKDDHGKVQIVIYESCKSLEESIKNIGKSYSKIIFIGKSIGTIVQINAQKRLEEKLANCTFKNIYLTPVEKTYDIGMSKGLVITGTSDTWISFQTVQKIKQNKALKVIIIEGANHSLNIDGDIESSVDVMKRVIVEEKKYILGN